MFNKIMNRFLRSRHYWRTVSFDELSELYTSGMLRSFGMSLMGIFVPIYLYKLGFSLTEICVYYVIYFCARPAMNVVIAEFTARYGPKHAQFVSYMVQVTGLLLLLTLPYVGWPLGLVALVNSFGVGLYFVAYHVDFSKVKHAKHGGHELGYATIFDRLGRIMGPVIGGLLATYVSPQATISVAIIVLLIAAWPLFRTREPVRINQKLDYNAFPFRQTWRYAALYTGNSMDAMGTAMLWPLFIALFIATRNTYATIGWLTALGTLSALVAARALGKLIDNKRVGRLFSYSVAGNALVYVARVFATSTGMVALINIFNEPLTLGYQMPAMKAQYDMVDQLEGFRIITFMVFESIGNFVRGLLWLLMLIMSLYTSERTVLSTGLILVGVLSLLMYFQKDPLLRTNQ